MERDGSGVPQTKTESAVCRSGRDQLVKSHGAVWQEKMELRTGQCGGPLAHSRLSGVERVLERMGNCDGEAGRQRFEES